MAGMDRCKSQFDVNELHKITHRGLTSLSRVDNEPRVTHQQLSTLKSQQLEEEKPAVVARRGLQQMLDGVTSAFKALLQPPKKMVMQCENYGHVLRPGWTGEFPTCADCGHIITSTSMVRGATPIDKEQSDSGRWRRVQ